MKIEMGESLIYTWLRHIKGCQIVQTNWRPSELWQLNHQVDLQTIMSSVNTQFPAGMGYTIFGRNGSVSLQQFIAQAEVDVLGSLDLGNKIFAVDVAFHENGLGYGSSIENASRIIKKCLRAAMCIYGYFDKKDAEVIFVAPKIHRADWPLITQGINDLKNELNNLGYGFDFKVICDLSNPDFQTEIMDPVMNIINNVSDTNELFVRSVQLLQMYYNLSAKVGASSSGRRPTTPVANPFRAYLGNVINRNGNHYTAAVINTFCASLNYHLFRTVLTNHGLPNDIYLCTDITALNNVYNELRHQTTNIAQQIFHDRHGACTSALRNYADYLRMNSLATNDQGQDFS